MAERHHLALYAGSFDPITLGHLDVLQRARRMFDELVLGIGQNPDKQSLFSAEDRRDMAESVVAGIMRKHPDDAPVWVQPYDGLTVEMAKSCGACAIVRGIRNTADLASESQLAITNRQVAGIETVFIVTGEAYAFTSSSLIRQIVALGGPLESLATMVPPIVIERMKALRDDPTHPLNRVVREALDD